VGRGGDTGIQRSVKAELLHMVREGGGGAGGVCAIHEYIARWRRLCIQN